jgi:hypothetical protein
MLEVTYMRGVTRCIECVERKLLRSWMYAHADCTILHTMPVTA